MPKCKSCLLEFEISPVDKAYLLKLSPSFFGKNYLNPDPVDCPVCRQKKRLAWRAERCLYSRSCDLTGKRIISIFHPESPYKVFSTDVWFGDGWDPCDYGQDYDPNRPFFEQYREVQLKTPRIPIVIFDNENSPYLNQAWHCKNCYLCYDTGYSQDVYYAYSTYHSKSSLDILRGEKLELAYECVDCSDCYNSVFLQDCHNCSDSYFSYDCQGCRNVLFCWNQRNKEYMVANKKVSPDEFKHRLNELRLMKYSSFMAARHKFLEIKSQAVHRASHNINCQNCVGDYLQDCKNCFMTYEAFQSEDCRYSTRLDHKVRDVMDVDHMSEIELSYNSLVSAGYQVVGCYLSVYSQNVFYCDTIYNSKNCFGCSSVNKKEYCILNKQYSQEDYEKLVPKIIEAMMARGEWGQFFPPECSLYGYNETLANEYWPMKKEKALNAGFLWSDYLSPEPQGIKSIAADKLPDSIGDIPDEVLEWAIICEKTGKAFKIIPQELAFYRKQGLPLPRRHPNQRYYDRRALRNPRELFERNCSKCEKGIQSSYSASRNEKVYCEQCYLKEVY